MAFLPGSKLLAELNGVTEGIWFLLPDGSDEVAIVAKLPSSVIKAIYREVQCFLIIADVESEKGYVRIVGLRIDDDATNPFFVSQPSLKKEEHNLINRCLSYQSIRIHYFDERSRPMLSATCSFNQIEVQKAIVELNIIHPRYYENDRNFVDKIHDVFQKNQIALYKRQTAQIFGHHQISYNGVFDPLVKNIEYADNENDITFQLDEVNEGRSFEKSIYITLYQVYTDRAYLSPEVPSDKSRELTDIAGFDSEAICLIQAKALSVFAVDILRPTSRRASSVKKDINKALNQLKGAVRQIREGKEILSSRKELIEVQNHNKAIIHGIVLISEMHHAIDWKTVTRQIFEFSNINEMVFFHVMELKELHTLSLLCHKNVPLFSFNLLMRWKAISDSGTAFLTMKLKSE